MVPPLLDCPRPHDPRCPLTAGTLTAAFTAGHPSPFARSLVSDPTKFHPFEAAALGNLCPDSPEEAVTFVPSLEHAQEGVRDEGLDEMELRDLVADMQTFKTFR